MPPSKNDFVRILQADVKVREGKREKRKKTLVMDHKLHF